VAPTNAVPYVLKPLPAIRIRDWWCDSTPTDNLEITWIGQAGFLLRYGSKRIVIDPYLSDSLAEKYRGKKFPHIRKTGIPIAPEAVTNADMLLCTHEHSDHLDPGSLAGILCASPRAVCVVPRFSVGRALERGVPENRIVPLTGGERFVVPYGIEVDAIPAAHEKYIEDGAGNAKFLGYRIAMDGIVVYHSGDTIPNTRLETSLRPGIDLALLPVNGRDEERRINGVPGNLTIEEALAYHRRFACAHTIVHHFGMFDFNSADPQELQNVVDSQKMHENVIVPIQGVVYERSRR
jgi:L-ascorbate metabolism protein UlaG (beta-lactamase superfamily)